MEESLHNYIYYELFQVVFFQRKPVQMAALTCFIFFEYSCERIKCAYCARTLIQSNELFLTDNYSLIV